MTDAQLQKLRALAMQCDARLRKSGKQSSHSNDIAKYFEQLLSGSEVEVGYRQQCGRTHATMFIAREWAKVVKRASKFGMRINERRVKHDNAWATLAEGFWTSIKYKIEA
jgi:hypothetical protein